MNIIIVAKPFSTPKVLRLTSLRSAAPLILLGLGLLSGTAVVGAVAGSQFVAPSAARKELQAAREELDRQKAAVQRVNDSVGRDMNALALRIGKLQAETTRLNALGERLAKIGKLDDGEFNFREEPALGGPETTPQIEIDANDVAKAVGSLESQLARQSQQLSMLESLLLDRELDQSMLPAGLPVHSGYASSGFGYRSDPFTGKADFHPGIDFNGQKGADILAVAGGVVSFVGQKPGYGNVVEIDHGNGFVTRYAHNDKNLLDEGTPVRAGDLIAKMGNTGRSTGVHVHFEVWQNGRLVNPSQYIRAMR
jgi:murein DD-endopeptidase MepM/ murein hydrolase activator NlpD